MAGTLNPSPAQIVAAIKDHGVPLRLYRGWDTRGREWAADESPGLMAVVNHHTATASATGETGAPSLEWCVTATSRGACNLLVGRGRDDVWLITAGSAFHSGLGGPWPAVGLISAGNNLHGRAFGIEIDDPGVRIGSMTTTQVEMVGRINAALMDLCGWSTDRVVTHQSWTDGLDGVNPGGRSQYVGRKNDTLRGDGVGPYSATFWRKNALKYVKRPEPVIPVVSLSGLLRKQYRDVRPVQVALNKVIGARLTVDGRWGVLERAAYSRWQRSLGYSGADADGVPGMKSLTVLGEQGGFRAVA